MAKKRLSHEEIQQIGFNGLCFLDDLCKKKKYTVFSCFRNAVRRRSS